MLRRNVRFLSYYIVLDFTHFARCSLVGSLYLSVSGKFHAVGRCLEVIDSHLWYTSYGLRVAGFLLSLMCLKLTGVLCIESVYTQLLLDADFLLLEQL